MKYAHQSRYVNPNAIGVILVQLFISQVPKSIYRLHIFYIQHMHLIIQYDCTLADFFPFLNKYLDFSSQENANAS